MIDLIDAKRALLVDLCRRHRVARLDVFGSAAKGTFDRETSDLDFVAQFEGTRDADYAERFWQFAEALEMLFERRVDLLTERMIQNPYFRQDLDRTRRRVVELSHESGSPQAAA